MRSVSQSRCEGAEQTGMIATVRRVTKRAAGVSSRAPGAPRNAAAGTMFYFAYGSNLDLDQMRALPRCTRGGLGLLRDYRLTFPLAIA